MPYRTDFILVTVLLARSSCKTPDKMGPTCPYWSFSTDRF
jgi:hypothetical protein